jgi:hypothetical protein
VGCHGLEGQSERRDLRRRTVGSAHLTGGVNPTLLLWTWPVWERRSTNDGVGESRDAKAGCAG